MRNPSRSHDAPSRRDVGERAQRDALAVERLAHARVAQDLDLLGALAVVDRAAVVAQPGVARELGDARRQASMISISALTVIASGNGRAVGGLPVEVAAVADAVRVVAQRDAERRAPAPEGLSRPGSQLWTCWWESMWLGSRPVSRRKDSSWRPTSSIDGVRVLQRHDLVERVPLAVACTPTRRGRRAARGSGPERRARSAAASCRGRKRTIRLALVRMPCSCARTTPAFTPGLRPKSSALTISMRSVIGSPACAAGRRPGRRRRRPPRSRRSRARW